MNNMNEFLQYNDFDIDNSSLLKYSNNINELLQDQKDFSHFIINNIPISLKY